MNVLSKFPNKFLRMAVVCIFVVGSPLIANVADNTTTKVEKLRRRVVALQNCQLHPKAPGGERVYVFEKGGFPEIEWENLHLVEKVIGKFPLKVRWFDAELNEVTIPEVHGRYAAVIEATTPDNIHIRRAMTLYCGRAKDWETWKNNPKAYVEYRPNIPIDKNAWEERKELIASLFGQQFIDFLSTEQKGVVILTYLTEMKSLGAKPAKTDTPRIRDNDYHLALKRKLLGVESKYPPLKIPRKIKGKPATVLRTDTPKEAGVNADTAEKIRAICRQWYAEGKEPFVVLVARHGVIIIHEAFGDDPHGSVTLDTPMNIASISKTLTGLMFAQFVDQELITLDDPVGKFLPDFPTEGNKAITLRHCFTHTTGLQGHGLWGGMDNPWLDNVIANGLTYLTPGMEFQYNGMDHDLVGKVMEIVSGKSIFRLMQENFFVHLGMKNTSMNTDMSFGTTCSAEDMAKIGQLMLNKGSYGDTQLFSPQTFEKLLPRPINTVKPIVNKRYRPDMEWGIGLEWMRKGHPDAGKNGIPADRTILSQSTIGHGARSSAILRVDLDNDLVISMVRKRAGKDYEKYLVQFLMAIENCLVK